MPTYTLLQTVTPPAVEPISLATAKLHLRIDNNDDDALIALYLTAARNWAEEFTGLSLITQQLRMVLQPQPFTGAFPYVSLPFPVAIYPLWYPWPDAMNYPTELRRSPVQTVDSIAYGQWGITPDVVVDPSLYQVDTLLGRVNFLPGATPTNSDHLSILFTVGFGETGAAVPNSILVGILMLLSMIYENRGDSGAEMPQAAKLLLMMYRRIGFGG